MPLLLGFGAGYVLGAKAGRERYEQLRRLYENLQSSPAVRDAATKAASAVGSGFDAAKDKAEDTVDSIKKQRSGNGSYAAAPPPNF